MRACRDSTVQGTGGGESNEQKGEIMFIHDLFMFTDYM